MSNFNEKVGISVNSALLFGLVNLPQAYNLTNSFSNLKLFNSTTRCPTNTGIIVHTLIFFIITFLSMNKSKLNNSIKLKHSIYGTLIFYLISSPAVFSIVGSFFGKQYANSDGCPTLLGIMLHALVYSVILVAVMHLPDRNKQEIDN